MVGGPELHSRDVRGLLQEHRGQQRHQRIGWDPIKKQIRSWTFDEDGGFGEATWTRDGDRWAIKSELVLADGKKITATNIITHIDADTITWQSKDRTVDGKPVPDVKEIKMKRVK